ncbi:MAG: head-tail connector protein [Pseudomonadota bacterium]|nr:head-tail connector protein [Pseudomonadota bacterium]
MNLAELKQHLNIEHDEDDALLAAYYEAAKDTLEGFLDLEIVDSDPTEGQIAMTANAKIAIYNITADLYDNRGELSSDFTKRMHNLTLSLRKF